MKLYVPCHLLVLPNGVMKSLKELTKEVVMEMVNEPDEVETHEVETLDDNDEKLTIIHVKVAEQDIGLCIGKGGSNAMALRRIIGLAGMQRGIDVLVKIDAPKRNQQLPENHFEQKYNQT